MDAMNWGQLLQESGGGFEPVPPNDYDVVVDSASHSETSTKKLMFKVKFKVMNGPYAGRPIWTNFVVSPENPNALGFFFQHMNALGLTKEYFLQNPPPDAIAAALVNRQARISVVHKTYQGSLRNEVKKIVALGAPAVAGQMAAPMVPPAAPAMPTPAPMPAPAPVPAAPAPVAVAPAPAPVVNPVAPQPSSWAATAPVAPPPAPPVVTEQPPAPPAAVPPPPPPVPVAPPPAPVAPASVAADPSGAPPPPPF